MCYCQKCKLVHSLCKRVYCCSVSKLCPDLCDPMDCSIPGFPVLHCIPEFAQTHVHWVSDASQPSHPLLPPSTLQFNSVQLLSRVQLFATPWAAECQASLSNTNSRSPRKLMSIESDASQPSHPVSSPSPPAVNLTQHQGLFQMSQLFASGGQSIGVSASTSDLPMNTYWLISFRTDRLDLLAVQGSLKSLLQHHDSIASILRRSAFFIV